MAYLTTRPPNLKRGKRRDEEEKKARQRGDKHRIKREAGSQQHLKERYQIKKDPVAVALVLQEFRRRNKQRHMNKREQAIADERRVHENEWHISDADCAPHPLAQPKTLDSPGITIEADCHRHRIEAH